jgi:hypothetical protein
MLGVSVEMSYCGDQDFIFFGYLKKSIRKTLQETASRSIANSGPCFRHEAYSVNCRIDFMEKAEA